MTDGKEDYVISNNDVIGTDLLNPRGGGLGSDDETDDLLTAKGERPMGGKSDHMQKQRKRGKSFKRHSQPAAVGRCCFPTLRFASRAPSVHFRTFLPSRSG